MDASLPAAANEKFMIDAVGPLTYMSDILMNDHEPRWLTNPAR
jgi:hypothetical protein